MPEGLPIDVDDVAPKRWEYGEVGASRRRLGVASGAKRLGVAVIVPPPTDERPPTIRNLAELPLHEGRDGRLAYATRDLRDMGSDKLVLAQDAMPPDTHNTDLHFHSAREEA